MWSLLTGLLGLADPITKITQAIANAKVALAVAATDQERINSQERVASLEMRRSVLIAEAGTKGGWVNQAIRAGFALPFVIYNAKLVLWDKVMGWGSTDPLSAELFQIEMACIGFYFLHEIASNFKRS